MDTTWGLTSSSKQEKNKGNNYFYHARIAPGVAACKATLGYVVKRPTDAILCRKCEIWLQNHGPIVNAPQD